MRSFSKNHKVQTAVVLLLALVAYTFTLPAFYQVSLQASQADIARLKSVLPHVEEWPKILPGFEKAEVKKLGEGLFEIHENSFMTYRVQTSIDEAKNTFTLKLVNIPAFEGSFLEFSFFFDGKVSSYIGATEQIYVHSLPARWYLHVFRGYSRDKKILKSILPGATVSEQKVYF